MARIPNYNQQRAERNRAKQAKKDAKLREREEALARRRMERREEDGAPATSAPPQPAAGDDPHQPS